MARRETVLSQNVNITSTRREWVFPNPFAGASFLGVKLDRVGFKDQTSTITIGLQISTDNGQTWKDWCSYSDQGGDRTYLNGSAETSSSFVATAPPAGVLCKGYAFTSGKTVRQTISVVEID